MDLKVLTTAIEVKSEQKTELHMIAETLSKATNAADEFMKCEESSSQGRGYGGE